MSHTVLSYHIVFGTYRRMQTIFEDHEKELYKFIYTYSRNRGVFIRRIGGKPDHIHILCDIPAKLAVASYVQTIKSESSKFMKINEHFPFWEGWAKEYGAFTVDSVSIEIKRRYIMNQKEHHRHISFAEEYRNMLREEGFADDIPLLGEEEVK